MTVKTACTEEAPPKREPAEFSGDLPERCPEGLVCYTEEEHSIVERAFLHLQKLERWSSLTWIACKPADEEEGETP